MPEQPDPNGHVKAYLDYYVSSDEPLNFAVLLDGPWGVGKSFLVKRYFEERGGDEPTHIYLSLYGISTDIALKRALFAAAYPILSGKGADIVGSIAKSAFGFFNLTTDLKPEEFAPIPKTKVIVVDDLERCSMPIHDALGQLNSLVEHDGHKLIILANQAEIPTEQRDFYNQRREKLIGQILTVRSDVSGALEYFISKLRTEDAKLFFEANREITLSLYEQSNVGNLRALQQSLWTFERLYGAIGIELRTNEKAMKHLLQLVLPLAIEFRTNGLSASDLQSRTTGLIRAARQLNLARRGEEYQKTKFEIAEEKYVDVDLRSEMLSNRVISQILVDGYVDADGIAAELIKAPYFHEIAPEEPWRTVWNGWDRSVAAFETAKDKMLNSFDRREFVDAGVILHVSALRLWLADLGYIAEPREELADQAIAYIDEVYERGAFNDQRPSDGQRHPHLDSHGLGFQEKETPEFQRISQHLRRKMLEAYEGQRSVWGATLLETLKNDASEFLQQVCFTNHGSNTFIRVPVLHTIDPDVFVDIALGLDQEGQQKAFLALKARYDNGELDRDLAEELGWVEAVRTALHSRAKDRVGIARWKLEMFDTWYFKPLLG